MSALMPGPLLAVTIAESPTRGKWTGPILVGGHAIAELAVIIILTAGLAAMAGNKIVGTVIGIVGGLMLIIMGLMMLYDLYKARIKAEAAEKQARMARVLGGNAVGRLQDLHGAPGDVAHVADGGADDVEGHGYLPSALAIL